MKRQNEPIFANATAGGCQPFRDGAWGRAPIEHRPPQQELTAENLALTRSGDGRAPFVLQGISLTVSGGEMVVLTGASGGGKSSLLLALGGMIPCNGGSVSINGLSSEAIPPPLWRSRVGLAQAEPQMVRGTVADNLRLAWTFRAGMHRAPPTDEVLREQLAALGLGSLKLSEDAGRLSTGQRERVALLRRMLPQPEFLLLDEPVANLDEDNARKVWQAVERFRRDSGAGVLCATHHQPPIKPTRTLQLTNGQLKA